ncbi:MAG: ATP-binding protein, partial [Desulfobacterales bacterium]
MPEKPSLAFTNLRKQAEEVLNQRHGNGVAEPAQTDLRHLLHELETHQVELEIQNEELRKTQQELEASRNEYLDLYHSAPVGFLSVNAKGVITRINRAAAEMFASPGKILVGDIFLSLIYATDVQIYMRFLNKAGLMKNEVCELQMVGKDGNILHVRLEARAELEGGKKIRHFAVTDLTELKRIKKELEQRVLERTAELNRRAEQLARLTSELMLTEQRERRRIAEILHDHLQQLLVGAKMNSEVLVPELEGNQRRVLEKIKDLIDKSIQASRTLTAELSPPALQQGRLSAALEWLAHWMKKHHGLTVEWRANTDLDPEREDITYLLYQCVRELLFNVVKHSGVESARIEMSDENDMLQVAVCDNGPGFDPKTIDETEETGFGLFSIRERLALLGGTLAVESISGGGVRVSISMP